jgi:hypothetical protein
MARADDDCKRCQDCGTPLDEPTADTAWLQHKYNKALELAHGFVALFGNQVHRDLLVANTDLTHTTDGLNITFKVKMAYAAYKWTFIIQCDDVELGAGFCIYLKNMILINTNKYGVQDEESDEGAPLS